MPLPLHQPQEKRLPPKRFLRLRLLSLPRLLKRNLSPVLRVERNLSLGSPLFRIISIRLPLNGRMNLLLQEKQNLKGRPRLWNRLRRKVMMESILNRRLPVVWPGNNRIKVF